MPLSSEIISFVAVQFQLVVLDIRGKALLHDQHS